MPKRSPKSRKKSKNNHKMKAKKNKQKAGGADYPASFKKQPYGGGEKCGYFCKKKKAMKKKLEEAREKAKNITKQAKILKINKCGCNCKVELPIIIKGAVKPFILKWDCNQMFDIKQGDTFAKELEKITGIKIIDKKGKALKNLDCARLIKELKNKIKLEKKGNKIILTIGKISSELPKEFVNNMNKVGIQFNDLLTALNSFECKGNFNVPCEKNKKIKNSNSCLQKGGELPTDMLQVGKSNILGAGEGVFAMKDIPKNTRIGEYTGKKLNKSQFERQTDTNYVFEVDNPKNKTHFYIDGKHSKSLMPKINGAKTNLQKKKINVMAYQYAQRIYYKTTKHVKRGTELIVDYGEDYWSTDELEEPDPYVLSYILANRQEDFEYGGRSKIGGSDAFANITDVKGLVNIFYKPPPMAKPNKTHRGLGESTWESHFVTLGNQIKCYIGNMVAHKGMSRDTFIHTKSGFSSKTKRQKAWDSCKNNAKANYDQELIVKYFAKHGFYNPKNLKPAPDFDKIKASPLPNGHDIVVKLMREKQGSLHTGMEYGGPKKSRRTKKERKKKKTKDK